ncbi:MAG: DUF4124 domain-containing protein [Thermodesulfobacteriota bacterium]
MKKLFFILLILIFASSASAIVYKWVDERGVTNFADDYGKVPPQYQSKVEELSMPKMASSASSGKATIGARSGEAKQPPPISQTLVREGDFAVKLAESLRMGRPTSEAEAENILASAGIAPKNGWIADYPVTPDIMGELAQAVGEAAEAKNLVMGKEEALKAVRTAAAELELPVIAEVPNGYTEDTYPTAPEYPEPPVLDDYYNAEGPPVITYYLPPPYYDYLYAWVPSPFWCSGFYFPGFYILHDFHRGVHHGHGYGHGHGDGHHYVTNHFRDNRTGKMVTIDPTRRHEGRTLGVREATRTGGFSSKEAGNAARSIYERSRERAGSKIPSVQTPGRDNRNPANWPTRRGNEKQAYNRPSNPQGFNNRNSVNGRPPVSDRRISRTPGQTGIPGNGRIFSRSESMNRQNGINVQRPSGPTHSFYPPSSQGSGRSFSLPQGGGQRFNSFAGGGGLSGSHQGGGGGPSGFHQGGGGSGGFGHGGARF